MGLDRDQVSRHKKEVVAHNTAWILVKKEERRL